MLNTLSAISLNSPFDKMEDCANFKIEELDNPFCMRNITTIGQNYTLSFWIRSDTPKSDSDLVIVSNARLVPTDSGITTGWVTSIPVTEYWVKQIVSFTADDLNLYWHFPIGTYYVYHAQLEVGDKATAWRPNPDDVDSAIGDVNETAKDAKDSADSALDQLVETKAQLQILGDRISSFVRDGDGSTLYQQDANGFYYIDSTYIENLPAGVANKLGELEGIVLDPEGGIDALRSDADALKELAAYIETVPNVDQGGPYIELGDPASPFKVRITNERIEFKEESVTPAYIDNQKLMIETAEVKTELQFGDTDATNTTGVWVWKQRSNGNLGLVWKDEPPSSNLISFTIENQTFDAESGMTWSRWCDSEYNTTGFSCAAASKTVHDANGGQVYYNETEVKSSDVIVENALYTIEGGE